nr:MAG TPA: hypothetical protein [Crassvirales sp.]
MEFDFGYDPSKPLPDGAGGEQREADDKITDLDGNSTIVDENGNPIEDLENHNDDKSNGKNNKEIIDDDTKKTDGDDTKKTDDTKETTLEVGSKISVGDDEYTVDESGNLIDKNGAIFKQASEVKEWIEGFDKVDETTNEISINTIQDAIGVEITDENDKPIEFDNTPEGIKSYVDAVIESARDEHYQTAINTLYQKYPILEDVLNYYVANGNSLDGFGEMPDRSGIEIDDNNEAQQEQIIRTAWKEQNRKGDVEGYLAYLKSSGTLLATAKEELAGLQEADEQYRKELADKAAAEEQEQLKTQQKYWTGVKQVIDSRKIAGYQIPDNIIVNRNGQKLSVTPNDFFNYIYRVDKDGYSAYQRDLAAETSESRRDDEILRAYLKFVGGNYSNLVGMAINKEKIANLKLKAKERNSNTIRITKPTNGGKPTTDIDLGY